MPAHRSNHATQTLWWYPIAAKPLAPYLLLASVLVLTLVWQWFSPFTLIEDEAHYWEWSRRLDWSYYSKGPGIALLIRASTALLGESEFAIRAPAALSLFLGAIACMRMTKLLFTDHTTSFIAALLYISVPGFLVSSMMMTIDAPYIACWAWAAFFAARAIMNGKKSDWIRFGCILALGFVFKYTILLLIPGVLLAVLVTRKKRPKINTPWMLVGISAVLIGLIPILIWNAQNEWATARHLLGHLGAPGGDTGPNTNEPYSITWTINYIALLFAVGGAPLVLGILGWFRSRRSPATACDLLLCMALPLIVFYLLVSLKAETEGNWVMSSFVTLLPPGAWCVREAFAHNHNIEKWIWRISAGGAMILFAFFPFSALLASASFEKLHIPIHRITGMREHARDAQRIINQLHEQTGLDPIIITDHYGRASQLAYYLDGHPTVYCNSVRLGGRKTQYDLWNETNLANPTLLDHLRGRPAVIFGQPQQPWNNWFSEVTIIGKLENEPKAHTTTMTALNFSPANREQASP